MLPGPLNLTEAIKKKKEEGAEEESYKMPMVHGGEEVLYDLKSRTVIRPEECPNQATLL